MHVLSQKKRHSLDSSSSTLLSPSPLKSFRSPPMVDPTTDLSCRPESIHVSNSPDGRTDGRQGRQLLRGSGVCLGPDEHDAMRGELCHSPRM